MALDKAGLKSNLNVLYTATLENGALTPAEAKDLFLTKLSEAIETFVKSAKVNYASGLTSATGGVVTGTFNGSLS